MIRPMYSYMFFYLAFLLFHVRKFNIVIEKSFHIFFEISLLAAPTSNLGHILVKKHFFNQVFSGN